jgi:hypothetical protein
MLTNQKLRIAWKTYLAELAAMQMAEHPSLAVVAERLRKFSNRLTEATRVLGEDSSLLAEVLVEILELVTGEAEIVGWRPVTLCEARERIIAGPAGP